MARELLLAFYGDPDNTRAGVEVRTSEGTRYVKTDDIVSLLAESLITLHRLSVAGKLLQTDDVAV